MKSTTKGSVSTVRDLSPRHIESWRGKHWLIAFYDKSGRHFQYAVYGSPEAMSGWIRGMGTYIAADLKIAEVVPSLIGLPTLHDVLGQKVVYTLEDATRLLKVQPKLVESLLTDLNIPFESRDTLPRKYGRLMDVDGGYSAMRMLEILRRRCQYLLLRGATLNNPSIPSGYFAGWPHLTKAEQLVVEVRQYLQKA